MFRLTECKLCVMMEGLDVSCPGSFSRFSGDGWLHEFCLLLAYVYFVFDGKVFVVIEGLSPFFLL